jgi:predicted extracellular nuclease
MHNDAAYKRDLLEVQKEMQKLGSQVEQLLSYREAENKLEVPDEANTLLIKEMADLKEENGKLKEEQLRAAAAAEAAEATRLAQLAAQSQAHSVQMEKLEQALAELRARLEETITQMKAKNAEITRLVDQREAAAQEYCTPQKYVYSENDSDYRDDFENFKESDFEDEEAAKRAQRIYLAKLWKAAQHGDKEQKSKKKSKQGQVTLHKRQGATPATHQAPVSGGSRRRDEIEPTGETPTQPTARSRSEEN